MNLALVLGASFPTSLPKIYLRPWDALGFIPHVDTDGFVCYAPQEGLFIDGSRPLEVIEFAVKAARQTMEDGVSRKNRGDFTDELEAYWRRLSGVMHYDSVLKPAGAVERILVAKTGKNHGIFARDRAELGIYAAGQRRSPMLEFQEALYVPLEPGTTFVPPRPDDRIDNGEAIRAQVLPNLSRSNHDRLTELLSKRRTRDTVLLCVPRAAGGESLVAFRAVGMRGQHVLAPGGSAEFLTPISVARKDRSYLLPRGGGAPHLDSKQVLLVGLGAVGARIAFELARSGLSQLTLVDKDEFTPDNTFRHVLGREFWGRQKVDSLKTALERDLPYVRVAAISMRLEEFLEQRMEEGFLSGFDLVISATGNAPADLWLNERIRTTDDSPPCIFTWLEPLGIGGHALLTLRGAAGCLECLHRDQDGSRRTHNRLSFAASDQNMSRALTGCGSLHMPFGSLDAARTAEMATRLAVSVLRDGERGNAVARSWRGDGREFTEAGFRVTPRFTAGDAVLRGHEQQFAVSSCPVCGPGSGR